MEKITRGMAYFVLRRILLRYGIKKDEISRACSTLGEIRNAHRIVI